jgi:hypothetical protein
MKIIVQRDQFLPNGTTGRLSVDGDQRCCTLEPPEKPQATDGPICIPAGTYPVKINFSPRFQRQMPRLFDVPGREGILIHWGNHVENTEGCILVGSSKSMIQGAVAEPAVWDSRETFDRLYREIEAAQAVGVELTIGDAGPMPDAHQHAVRMPISVPLEES